MRILYVNHTGSLGGAEHSLLTLLEGLPADVEPVIACPPGPLRDRIRALGIESVVIRGTSGSFALHPVRTPKALAQMARSAMVVQRAARRLGASVIHANSVRAGLIAVLGRAGGTPPVVVHVRDVLPPGATATVIRRAVLTGAARTVCISEHVAQRFTLRGARRLEVVHNGLDLTRFSPARVDRAAARAALRIAPDEHALGVVAQLTPWKGQDDAIAALAGVHAGHPRTRLLLVGEAKFVGRDVRHDTQGYAARLDELALQLGVSDAVHMLGERADVPALLAALDVALVPSWEEPFGRSVIEAMAMERALIATCAGGPREIVEHGLTGLLAPPRRPAHWAQLIGGLLDDPQLRDELGTRARRSLSGRFDQRSHVERMLTVYRGVLSPRG